MSSGYSQNLAISSRWVVGGFDESYAEAIFLKDSAWILTVHDKIGGIRVWDSRSFRLKKYYPRYRSIDAVFDPERNTVISGSFAVVSTSVLTDIQTEEVKLNNHNPIRNYCFNESKTVLLASVSDTLYCWKYPSFELAAVTVLGSEPFKLSFFKDSIILASLSSHQLVQYSANDLKPIDSISLANSTIGAFDLQDSLLLINDGVSLCALYNLNTRKYLRYFRRGSYTPQASYSSSKKYLYLNAEDSLTCYRLSDYKPVWSSPISVSIGPISSSPNDSTVLIAGAPGNTSVYDGKTGRFNGFVASFFPQDICFSNSGEELFFTSAPFGVESADVLSGARVRIAPDLGHQEYSIALGRNPNLLIRGHDYGRISMWDLSSSTQLWDDTEGQSAITKIRLTSQEGVAIFLSESGELVAYDYFARDPIKTLLDGCVDFDENDTQLWALDSSNTIHGFDLASLSETVARYLKEPVNTFKAGIGPDAVFIAKNNSVTLFHPSSGEEVQSYIGHSSYISDITVRSDGKYIATTSWDSTIKSWEVASGKMMRSITPYPDAILRIESSPDNERFAVITNDMSLVVLPALWNQSVVSSESDQSNVFSIDDSQSILIQSRCSKGNLRICDIAGRQLSEREIQFVNGDLYKIPEDLMPTSDWYLIRFEDCERVTTVKIRR